jgi:uncharacterized protein YbaR (Trm112 family)
MPLSPDLIQILCCPKCKGDLTLREDQSAFVCAACRLVFAVQEGVPNFLLEEAKPLEPAA